MSGRKNGDGKESEDLANAPTLAPRIVSLYGEELEPGAAVGLYVVEEMIGKGGFACVYRGRHMKQGTTVAIKILHDRLAGSETQFRRFEREIETIQRLRHPGIIEMFEWGQLPTGRPYMVMEWLEGPTLDQLIRARGPMTIDEILPFIEALCAPLALAHREGIVHRDLKPANVIVTDPATPRLKLLDFGLAKLLDAEDTGLTSTGARLGTPDYMAPEQILGAPISPATDIYALGVIVFHMLTGTLPFHAPSAIEIHELHLRAIPPRVSEQIAVPPSVDLAVRRCMHKQPAARPATVTEIYDELAAAAANPQRPTNRFSTGEAGGVAIHVARGDGTLESARAACLAAGFSLVIDEESDFLAVMPLPTAAGGADVRSNALTIALSLQPGLRVRVHEAPATLLTVAGMVQVVGGPLLDLELWPDGPAEPGVYASNELVTGVRLDIDVEPAPGHPAIRRVRRR